MIFLPNNPVSVLRTIAMECRCSVVEIEKTLENLNDNAGLMPRMIPRETTPERKLETIRQWLGTPEGYSIIEPVSYTHLTLPTILRV